VTIASPPVVNFKLATKQGVPVVGFGSTSKASTATVASYPNLAFSLAKLIPASGGTPSKWVSYIVTTVPVTTASSTCAANAVCLTRPSTDNTGTLVDNKDGSYTYTFYRDIPGIKAVVAGITPPANTASANYDKAQLGDLTYDPALTHRLTIQISGNAPGTGTNTPNGVQTVTGVPMTNAVDVVYDFVPATGQPPAAAANRKMTTTSNCNACHSVLGGIPGGNPESSAAGFHGGSRNNVEYCVVCHTDQRKWGRVEATYNATNLTFSGSTYVVDGRSLGDMPNMIHKTHLGHHLARQGYDYAGVQFNHVGYPQDSRNCQNCHSAATPEQAATTPQGDNWKTAPSRLACGACHDGINFDTGLGVTLKDAAAGLTVSTGFNGKAHPANATDAGCTNAGCHGVENGVNKIDLAHIPVTPPSPNNALLLGGTNANTNAAWIASGASANRLPTGAIKVTYEVSSVSRNASKQPVMVFRLLQNGARKDLNDFATAAINPATGQKEIWDNFMGAPSVYFVWSVPQDGIAKPQDFNATASRLLRTLWAGGPSAGGTLTGPDANGFYTATLTGSTVPDNAAMLTGGLGYSYNVTNAEPLTQTNLAAYPTAIPTNPTYAVTPGPRTGGLVVIAPNINKVATGYTGRRAIVEDKRCNACHQELGTFTADAFHAGQRNDGTTCSWCHTPNRGSGGWSADSVAFVHATHAAAKRSNDYTWHAVDTKGNDNPADFSDFSEIGYPGVLANCEQCHLPNTYNFGVTASADAAGIGADGIEKRLWRTVATGFYRGTAGATVRTFSGADCLTFGTSSAQTNLGVFTQPKAYGLMQDATGDAATPNTGTYYGDGFRYNAGINPTNPACTANGTVVPANPAQGIIQATPETLVMSATVAACTGCHDSNLAISHMRVNGGSFYESRAVAATRTEQCMVCHAAGRTADTKVVHGVK
jgi:OmcA/MtrC family decaheme c-type cytochrome